MPLSGSYFYPGINAPNSSYPTLDLRGLDSIPPAAGLGRLFVLSSSQDLYYEDADGNVVVIAAATGSAVFDNIDATKVFNSRGPLVLSSSLGSIIAVSGALELSDVGAFQINARNSHLILSSSAGSTITISGTVLQFTASDGLRLTNGGRSTTVPNIIPDRSQTGTGIAAAAGNNLCLITNSAVALEVFSQIRTSTSHAINVRSRIFNDAGHVIMSSSTAAGSGVRISGTLLTHKEATTTLPAGADILSGGIVFDTTLGCLKVYSNNGWVRILTGTIA